MVNSGLDGGDEFSFVVSSKDGGELLVSVMRSKEPVAAAPSGRGALKAKLARKDAAYIEQQRAQNHHAKVERRRKRFLGIED